MRLNSDQEFDTIEKEIQDEMFELSKLYFSQHLSEANFALLGVMTIDKMKCPECLGESMWDWVRLNDDTPARDRIEADKEREELAEKERVEAARLAKIIYIDKSRPELFWGRGNINYKNQSGVPLNRHTGEYNLRYRRGKIMDQFCQCSSQEEMVKIRN